MPLAKSDILPTYGDPSAAAAYLDVRSRLIDTVVSPNVDATVEAPTDGREETCVDQDLFYRPPGHSVRVIEDAEVILFSPQGEHGSVMEHMLAKMAG